MSEQLKTSVTAARAMQILADLAKRAPLRMLDRVCEQQKQISTVKLADYIEQAGDELAGYAFNLRQHNDALHAEAEALRAENAKLRTARAEQGERQEAVAYWDVSRSLVHMACEPFNQGEQESMAHCRPLYTAPQPAQVNRIPAGLYAELEALRTLRDATGVYLQGYMRDEIEDEESCSADQHDSACTVKLALDKARALEWKGGGDA
jgi:hypothetical protein